MQRSTARRSDRAKLRPSAQNVTFNLGQAQLSAKYKDVGSIRLQMKDPTALPGEIRGSTELVCGEAGRARDQPRRNADGRRESRCNERRRSGFRCSRCAVSRRSGRVRTQRAASPRASEPRRRPRRFASAVRRWSCRWAGATAVRGTGTLGGATAFAATATQGRFRNDSATFDEAGIMRIVASVADGDYLGGGVVNSTPSGNVGRFPPARFALVAGNSVVRRVHRIHLHG